MKHKRGRKVAHRKVRQKSRYVLIAVGGGIEGVFAYEFPSAKSRGFVERFVRKTFPNSIIGTGKV